MAQLGNTIVNGVLRVNGGIFASAFTGNLTGNVTGNVTGNASSATKLQTARTINGVSFDGSANITVKDSTKLPLSGGTITGHVYLNGIKDSTLDSTTKIIFGNSTTQYGCIRANTSKSIVIADSVSSNALAVEYIPAQKAVRPVISASLDLGASSNKWNNVYANTFIGALSGNATTATTATSATKATQDSDGKAINTTYFKLTGGTISGDVFRRVDSVDASLANNNLTTDNLYPTTFNILDKSNRILSRIECIPKSNGTISSYWYVRNYDTAGTMTGQKGIKMIIAKNGSLSYEVAEPTNFRNAINIKAMASADFESSKANLPDGSIVAVW